IKSCSPSDDAAAMPHLYSLDKLKRYLPYAPAALLLGLGFLYVALSKDTQHLDDHRIIVTNHWTGEVKRCVVTPDQKHTCRPCKSVEVPWYLAIVQHT